MDNNKMLNLNALLKLLMDKDKSMKIDPSNFPNLQTAAVTDAISPYNPGVSADIAASGGYPVSLLKDTVMGGKMSPMATDQLYQLLTSQFRGMRGLETPSLLDAFKNAVK